MKKITKIMTLIAAMLLIVSALAACGGNSNEGDTPESKANKDDGKVYEITVNMTQAPMATTSVALQEACDAIEEASGGRLKFQVEFGGNILGIMETWTGVADGRADISFCPSNVASDYLSLTSNLFCLPFIGFDNAQQAYDVYNQLREEYPEIDEEFEAYGVKNLGAFFNGPDQIFLNHAPGKFEGMDSIKGMKLGTSEAFLVQFINKNGGAAVFTSSADLYTNLDSGVIEGMSTHALLMQVTKSDELVKGIIEFGDEGMMRGCSLMIMNLDTFNSLPEDLQQLIVDGFADYCAKGQEIQNNDVASEIQKMKDNGAEVLTLTADQYEPLRELAKAMVDPVIQTANDKGYRGQEIYDRIQELSK